MRLSVRLLFFCLSLLSLPALAAPVPGLYQVREPVADQQPESRDAAMQKALQTLVLRLTGDAKALLNPALEGLRLVDYKVRILTPNDGTKAVTRVMIESTDGHGNRWTTVGVSANVIDASYNALHDSITYRLFRASGTRTPDASADNR